MVDLRHIAQQRKRLMVELRSHRETLGLSQQAAAEAIGNSLSTVVRIENGVAWPTRGQVIALMHVYKQVDDALELANIAEEVLRHKPRDEELLKGIASNAYLRYREMELAADEEYMWSSGAIPGVLQIEEYAYEFLQNCTTRKPAQIERMVTARLERQAFIIESGVPHVSVLLDESVLRRPLGATASLAKQFSHIASLIESRRIDIGVVPHRRGLHLGMQGAFTVLEMRESTNLLEGKFQLQRMLFLETLAGDFFRMKEDDRTVDLQQRFLKLKESAISGDALLQLLRAPAPTVSLDRGTQPGPVIG